MKPTICNRFSDVHQLAEFVLLDAELSRPFAEGGAIELGQEARRVVCACLESHELAQSLSQHRAVHSHRHTSFQSDQLAFRGRNVKRLEIHSLVPELQPFKAESCGRGRVDPSLGLQAAWLILGRVSVLDWAS